MHNMPRGANSNKLQQTALPGVLGAVDVSALQVAVSCCSGWVRGLGHSKSAV
jgi:hypothetical protein